MTTPAPPADKNPLSIKEKIAILAAAQNLPLKLLAISTNPPVKSRILRVGTQVCRSLAYLLRYEESFALSDSAKLEGPISTALYDQRVFETARNENPAQLTKKIASQLHQIITQLPSVAPSHTLYFLELGVIACELYESPMRKLIWGTSTQ